MLSKERALKKTKFGKKLRQLQRKNKREEKARAGSNSDPTANDKAAQKRRHKLKADK